MIPVGDHGLGCLDDEDYAALALYMQSSALAVEAALVAQRDDLNEYRLRTSIEFISTVTTSNAALGGTVMHDGREANGVDFTAATVLGGGSTVTATGNGNVCFIPAKSGWYDVGGYTNVIPAGAITAGSERVLYIQVVQTPDLPATDSTTLFQERVTDTNTGGEFLNVSGLVYLIAGRSACIEMLVAHGNLASNLVMQVGSKIWLAYFGPKGVIVSA